MYIVNEDKSIYVTRGDAVVLTVNANNNGVPYVFHAGEVVRFRVFEKKGCHCTVLQKDFILTEDVESVDIALTKNETKFGEIISKPKDYWYEIELNPDYNPQTIVGYDDNGPKIFRLFPEGADTEGGEGEAPDEFWPVIPNGLLPNVTEEDNGKTMRVVDGEWELSEGITVDDKLIEGSTNPVQGGVLYQKFKLNESVYDNIGQRVQTLEDDVVDLQKKKITVDYALSDTSTNPVQNKVIAKAIDGMKPVRVTVTKTGNNKYEADKTHQELLDILAEDEHRSIICELNGYDIPLVKVFPNSQLLFEAHTSPWSYTAVQISSSAGMDTVRVENTSAGIAINGQLWGEEDPNADFTDTINDMVADKVNPVVTRIDALESKGVLVVTWDGKSDSKASVPFKDIISHIQEGGTAVLHYDKRAQNEYWTLSSYSEGFVQFACWDAWQEIHYGAVIWDDETIDNFKFMPPSGTSDILIHANWADESTKKFARDNIGAASAEDVTALTAELEALRNLVNGLIG